MQTPGLAVDAFATQLVQSFAVDPEHVYQLAWHDTETQFNASPESLS